MSTGYTTVFGFLAGICFTILISYLLLILSPKLSKILRRAWVVVIALIVLFHVLGVTAAFAAGPQDSPASNDKQQTTDQEIQDLRKEIEKLKQEAAQAKKEKEAKELRQQAEKLKGEIKQLKKEQGSSVDSSSTAPPAQPIEKVKAARVMIPAGTPVILSVDTGFNAADVREGDNVALLVLRPVRIEETTLIRAGVAARATVASRKAPASWGEEGAITLDVKSVPAVDGSNIMLRGRTTRKGESAHGAAAGAAVGGAIFCFPLALTGFMVTGEHGEFPTGHEIVAHTDANYWIRIYPKEQMEKIAEEQDRQASKISDQFRYSVEKRAKERKEAEKAVDEQI